VVDSDMQNIGCFVYRNIVINLRQFKNFQCVCDTYFDMCMQLTQGLVTTLLMVSCRSKSVCEEKSKLVIVQKELVSFTIKINKHNNWCLVPRSSTLLIFSLV
jgi:hypothetical protein